MKKILLASANPYSFCIAFENHWAKMHAGEWQVDAFNMYRHCTRYSPFYASPLKRLAVAMNRKYERFIVPALSGRDITADIHIDTGNIPPLPKNERQLREYKVDGADIGIGVLSSVVSLSTIQNPVTLGDYGEALDQAWRAAHYSARVGGVIKDLGYDEVYIFNGRHCYARPFCDVVEQTTRLIRYEVGGSEDTTTYITADSSIHAPARFARIVKDHAVSETDGRAFFQDRINRAPGDQVNYFLGLQVEGLLPDGLSSGSYVAQFTTSSDEMFALMGEAGLGEFASQFQLAMALAKICKAQGKTLVLRLHPHLRYKHPSWKREWDFEALASQGVVVIQPDDPVDSYALARSSHCVITGGSTVSIECAFLGIPNAAVGDTLPGHLGTSIVLEGEKDLARFVAEPVLAVDAVKNAIVYGSYCRRGGFKIPGYEIDDHIGSARVNGRVLDPVRFLARPFTKLLRSSHG